MEGQNPISHRTIPGRSATLAGSARLRSRMPMRATANWERRSPSRQHRPPRSTIHNVKRRQPMAFRVSWNDADRGHRRSQRHARSVVLQNCVARHPRKSGELCYFSSPAPGENAVRHTGSADFRIGSISHHKADRPVAQGNSVPTPSPSARHSRWKKPASRSPKPSPALPARSHPKKAAPYQIRRQTFSTAFLLFEKFSSFRAGTDAFSKKDQPFMCRVSFPRK